MRGAKGIFLAPDVRPGFHEAKNKNPDAGKNDHAADQPPVGKQFKIVIVRVVGPLLEFRRPVFAETVVEMRPAPRRTKNDPRHICSAALPHLQPRIGVQHGRPRVVRLGHAPHVGEVLDR